MNSDITGVLKRAIMDDNKHIREWYFNHVSNIPNEIDKTKSIEHQARQACTLRNKYKREARAMMPDKETAAMLNKKRPAKSFEELLEDKMKRKGLTRDQAVIDILRSASVTNKDVNKEFGIGDDDDV